jgi:ribosome-associated toxin RatA of RatAB toxin-antitoxin module
MRAALVLVLILTWLLGIASPALAGTVEASATARVAASPERVIALLSDFESWDRVFESVETLRAEREDDHHARVRQRVRRAGFTMSYTLAARVDPAAGRVEMALDESEPTDMERLATSWHVVPHPEGGSLIRLHVVTRTKLPVPAFLERHIAESTARDSLRDLIRALDRVAESQRRVDEG